MFSPPIDSDNQRENNLVLFPHFGKAVCGADFGTRAHSSDVRDSVYHSPEMVTSGSGLSCGENRQFHTSLHKVFTFVLTCCVCGKEPVKTLTLVDLEHLAITLLIKM